MPHSFSLIPLRIPPADYHKRIDMKFFVSCLLPALLLQFTFKCQFLNFNSIFHRIKILAVCLALACAISAQIPAGWNYNPFLYYPYSALQPPAQETAEVAAARAAHMAAHAAARGKRSVEDTPEVMATTIEHYQAYNAAATANGMPMAFLPARYANMPFAMPQPVQETPEVAAARRAHLAAHALAADLSKTLPK